MNGQAQTHDADGNLTVFQLSAAQPVILNGYDSENRMVSTETAGNTRIDNRYDPLHRRVLKRVSTWDSGSSNWVLQKTVRFTYDHWNVIEEEEITASATRTGRYTWGSDLSGTMQGAGGVGGLLRSDETIGTNPVSTHYFWYDGNGNVTGLMRSNGTIDATYRYTAFGGKASVAFTSGTFGERNRYRFSTKYLDDEVETVEGTYYYGYRHYVTALGKWGARDPIGERGGVNLYGMMNSVNSIDLLGLCKCIVISVVVDAIDVDDSEAAGETDDLFDGLIKILGKVGRRGRGGDSVSSLAYGYTWQITVKTQKKNCETDEWEDFDDFVKSPEIDKLTVFDNMEAAKREGENHRKEARDEAKAKCESSCSSK